MNRMTPRSLFRHSVVWLLSMMKRSILKFICFYFRFSRYFKYENGTDYRTLFKAYGVKFVLTIQGRAGKFRIVPLVLNIGSGLALLSVVRYEYLYVSMILCTILSRSVSVYPYFLKK